MHNEGGITVKRAIAAVASCLLLLGLTACFGGEDSPTGTAKLLTSMTVERYNQINDIAHDYVNEDFMNVQDPLCAIRLLTCYYDEIMNGGFGQYFSNMDSGYDFHEHHLLLDALDVVGMKKFKKITRRAIALAKKCESENERTAERADEKLEALSFVFDDAAYIEQLYSFADTYLNRLAGDAQP